MSLSFFENTVDLDQLDQNLTRKVVDAKMNCHDETVLLTLKTYIHYDHG